MKPLLMLSIALCLLVTAAAGPVNNLVYPLKPTIQQLIEKAKSIGEAGQEAWGGKR